MTSDDRKRDWKREAEERTRAEIARGQAALAQRVLSARFNPNHTTDYILEDEGQVVSPAERARRDEYRNRLAQQNGGQNK